MNMPEMPEKKKARLHYDNVFILDFETVVTVLHLNSPYFCLLHLIFSIRILIPPVV
jgi:hypothetical protein